MRSHFHCVYKMQFHLVLVTKYRNKWFTDEILTRLEEILREQCKKWDVDLVQFGAESDHCYLLLELHPNIEPAKLVNSLKTVSSRLLRKEYADHLAKHYWKPVLWARGYCLLTTGGASLEILENYIANQDRPK
ncbi:IS200/IS605 family transposase [Photobacterium damselae]|uniref:IS200/IS605 family transposase n=1 Tax=Photobacterium damselae TaxID=38293 RepID=UPI0022AB0F1A|nr:IS200/IS605 family transposase [Photobacterium damselae]